MGLFSLFKERKEQEISEYDDKNISENNFPEEINITEKAPTMDEKDNSETISNDVVEEKIFNSDKLYEELGEYNPILDLSAYQIPPIELLDSPESLNINLDDIEEIKNKIIHIFELNKIKILSIKTITGYVNVLFEIQPDEGFRISKIKQLKSDLIFALQNSEVSVEQMLEKGLIGVVVPNKDFQKLPIGVLIKSKEFIETDFKLPLIIGKTITNENFIIDLTEISHILVSGATGQGKSVLLNVIITSLLYKKHPSEVKFILIDPHVLEFNIYSKIENHFLAKVPYSDSIVTDVSKAIYTLNSLCLEMDVRYTLLKAAQVRNIKEYNSKFINRELNPCKGHRFFPYIVLIIDEYADLVIVVNNEIEASIERLARKAHTVGIHIVLATQRPTKNIITGKIKSNFLTQIAFKVSSSLESRIIMDKSGAENLSGKGDVLYHDGLNLTRIQVPYISTEEIDKISTFINTQQGYPSALLLPEYPVDNIRSEIDISKRDDLFDDAARLIVIHQLASTSLIQRKFSIGYNRAGRIMDQLEAAGIVGPNEGSKARQVLFIDEASLENYLNKLNNGDI
jgi:S-DNA-T family DNA segregation ATPase FtsK/SpoIIIE